MNARRGRKRELDGVLDRDDVPGFRQVDRLDQRGQRRRFAAAGRPADEDQSIGVIDQVLKVRMQIQRLDRRLEGRQQPDGKTNAARGVKNVDAAAHALHLPGKIQRAALFKLRPVIGTDDFARPLLGQSAGDGRRHGRKLLRTRNIGARPGSKCKSLAPSLWPGNRAPVHESISVFAHRKRQRTAALQDAVASRAAHI